MNLPLLYQGKSRDSFLAAHEELMLVVATNRVSTHNIVHASQIPLKGEVLTMLTIFLFLEVLEKSGIRHHLVAWGTNIYKYLPGRRSDYPANLHHYAIIVRRVEIVQIEFIFRAYLCGSLWTKYYSKGLPNPYGIDLPPGLPLMHRFEAPLFTPTDKSDTDDPRNALEVETRHSTEHAETLRGFTTLRTFFQSRNMELVDGKLEGGYFETPTGERIFILADEISPDSCRLTNADNITEGVEPAWRDKEIVRTVATKMWGDREKVPLAFPPDVLEAVTKTYLSVLEQATGMDIETFRKEWLD